MCIWFASPILGFHDPYRHLAVSGSYAPEGDLLATTVGRRVAQTPEAPGLTTAWQRSFVIGREFGRPDCIGAFAQCRLNLLDQCRSVDGLGEETDRAGV
jgi:hypothetical protein